MQIRVRQCICDPCEFETYEQQFCSDPSCKDCDGYSCSFDVSPEYSGDLFTTDDTEETTTTIINAVTEPTEPLLVDDLGWFSKDLFYLFFRVYKCVSTV